MCKPEHYTQQNELMQKASALLERPATEGRGALLVQLVHSAWLGDKLYVSKEPAILHYAKVFKDPLERYAMNKAIITVVGQDTVGIIARVCTYLSDHKVNVLDISQTIIDGFFNMMMIVDYSAADESFGAMAVELESLGEEIGVRVRAQREEIFTAMHRI